MQGLFSAMLKLDHDQHIIVMIVVGYLLVDVAVLLWIMLFVPPVGRP